MALDDPLTVASLVSINVALYASAFGGFLRSRRAASRPTDPAKAFALLDRSLKKAFPDLPNGFTWREALQKVERLDLGVDWSQVRVALKQYEAWRYGEMPKPEDVSAEVVRLARELSRRGRRWPRV